MPRSRHRLSLAVTALVTLAALTTASCSGGSDGTDAPGSAAGSTRPASPASPKSETPVVTRTTRLTAGENGPVEIGLVDLRTSGRLAVLRLTFTPHLRTDRPGGISLLDMAGGRGGSVSLVDTENLRRYLVVRDSRNEPLGPNPAVIRTVNDSPLNATFTFAAPPAEVKKIDVYLDDQIIFDEVEIAS
ncbi:hypothetical protein [Frankia sp. QA3]|uniref:hypothetical protein n=1 Tax=Frankia sp. QA3 TaxID=710111 RepID=UPI000269C94C|nr:hypothetical protein [Frankia sp. QA3]EIV94999.1 hypothetical protein FraQA3DRAFT_4798 [Frankia sp. QA3]